MKANEFIKRHGVNRAKEVIVDTPARAEYYRDMDSVCSPNEVLYYVWFGCKLLVSNDGEWEPSIYHNQNEYILEQLESISELKKMIVSHEIVMEHGSLSRAKSYANSDYTAPEVKEHLLKAIYDVESCQ